MVAAIPPLRGRRSKTERRKKPAAPVGMTGGELAAKVRSFGRDDKRGEPQKPWPFGRDDKRGEPQSRRRFGRDDSDRKTEARRGEEGVDRVLARTYAAETTIGGWRDGLLRDDLEFGLD